MYFKCWPWPCARSYSRHFSCINSFYLHRNITRLSSLYGGNGGSIKDLAKGYSSQNVVTKRGETPVFFFLAVPRSFLVPIKARWRILSS